MQFRTIFIGLLSVTLFSGCAWFNSEKNTAAISSLPKVDNQFQLKTIWKHSVGNGSGDFYSNLHPAWQGSRVFAADRHGIVKALDVDTGKKVWLVDLSIRNGFFLRSRPAQLSGGLTAAGTRVYLGSELAKVYALNTQDGSISWEASVAGEALSTPVVSDGTLLVHTSNGMLQALNETNGAIKWTVNLDVPPLTLRGVSSPTTAFGAAIVGGDNGRVSAVLINQGQLIWQQRISHLNGMTEIARLNDVKTTPVVVNGVVYALAYNGNLVALDLYSGQVLWSREKIGSTTNLLVDGSRIYLVDQDDRVIAVNIQDGIIVWCQSKLMHRNLTSPVLYNGYIVTGDSEGYLHWINTDDGQFVAQQKVDGSGLLSTPVIANSKLIVQAKNGKVYAFAIEMFLVGRM
ncbi:MAG: outer membrane protein assembly factor BamB [Sodalis sp. Psp]|nr:outer membrane protein assembly factor BamB [Sodalis sp. Psp]MCR3757307.1 outer membrane protein assembly factor BamB [Sodalis sp. Ppy]